MGPQLDPQKEGPREVKGAALSSLANPLTRPGQGGWPGSVSSGGNLGPGIFFPEERGTCTLGSVLILFPDTPEPLPRRPQAPEPTPPPKPLPLPAASPIPALPSPRSQ